MGLRERIVIAEPAAQLALLRIVVPAMIVICPETRHAPQLAAVPAALRVAPEGLGWFVSMVPISPSVATVAQAACVFSAMCTAVGVRARAAAAVMTITAFYLFALTQLSGAVWHDMHLLWMAALLAASPCDEALAYDPSVASPSGSRPEGDGPQRGKRGELAPDSTRYGWPLFFARALLACIYFFPGLHKLVTSGLGWALSDNLRNQLWWKWAEHGITGALRVDRVPGLLQAGGLFVLAFELTFPLFVLSRRARPWLALAGLAFHFLAGALLRIPFVSLWALYVVLLDLRRIPRIRAMLPPVSPRHESAASPAGDRPQHESAASPAGDRPRHQKPSLLPLVVGLLLFAGAFVQGARGQMRAFPFACYPTFQWVVGTRMPDLVVEVELPDGRREPVPHARDARGYRTQRQWGEIWSLAGVTGPVSPERLRAYYDFVRRGEPARTLTAGAVRVRFYRASLSVVPEQRGEPPRLEGLLAEIALTPS
jgi:hypothetical protein